MYHPSLQAYTGQLVHGVRVAAVAVLIRLGAMNHGVFSRQSLSAAQSAMGSGQVVETLDKLSSCDGTSVTMKPSHTSHD